MLDSPETAPAQRQTLLLQSQGRGARSRPQGGHVQSEIEWRGFFQQLQGPGQVALGGFLGTHLLFDGGGANFNQCLEKIRRLTFSPQLVPQSFQPYVGLPIVAMVEQIQRVEIVGVGGQSLRNHRSARPGLLVSVIPSRLFRVGVLSPWQEAIGWEGALGCVSKIHRKDIIPEYCAFVQGRYFVHF